MPQSQISNCRRTSSFSGDFDNIAQEPHGNRPAAVQFERWLFIFETPSGAFSWFRKKLYLDGDWGIFEPLDSLSIHHPGSVRALSGYWTIPSEIGRRPDNFTGLSLSGDPTASV